MMRSIKWHEPMLYLGLLRTAPKQDLAVWRFDNHQATIEIFLHSFVADLICVTNIFNEDTEELLFLAIAVFFVSLWSWLYQLFALARRIAFLYFYFGVSPLMQPPRRLFHFNKQVLPQNCITIIDNLRDLRWCTSEQRSCPVSIMELSWYFQQIKDYSFVIEQNTSHCRFSKWRWGSVLRQKLAFLCWGTLKRCNTYSSKASKTISAWYEL